MKSDRKRIIGFARDYRVDKGHKFRLKDFDPGDDGKLKSKEEADALLAASVKLMSDLQEKLYAQERCPCFSYSRRWTRPARTARSSTSCRH